MGSNAEIQYLKEIADALSGIKVTGGSASRATTSAVKVSSEVSTLGIINDLDKGLMTEFSEESQLRISALAMLKASLIDELKRAFFVTVDNEEKSVFELIHDEIDELKALNIRQILSHLSLHKLNEGTASEKTYLMVDIGLAGMDFGSFGGVTPGSGDQGASLDRMWQSIMGNVDKPNALIDAHHIPIGAGLSINQQTGLIDATISGLVPVSQGGTGITSISAYSLLYGHATDATKVALLAPNTDTTKKYLTMTGSGSAGAAPVWNALTFADLPDQYIAGTKTIQAAAKAPLYGISSFRNLLSTNVPSPDTDKSLVEWNSTYDAWYFKGNIIAEGYGSFGGANPGSASYTSLSAVWDTLTGNTGTYANTTINPYHIPIGSGLTIVNGLITASVAGTVTVPQGGTGLTSIAAYSLLYSPSANTLTTLAPNTEATKKYLTMTGSGSAGAAPVWSALTFADLPDQYIAGTKTIAAAAKAPLYGISSLRYLLSSEVAALGSATDPSFIYWDTTYNAWHLDGNLIVNGYGSFGGANPGSAAYTSLQAVWDSLTGNTGTYQNTKINPAHLQLGNGLTTSTVNGLTSIIANLGQGLDFSSGAITVNATVVRTQYSGGLNLWLGTTAQLPVPAARDANTIYLEKSSS